MFTSWANTFRNMRIETAITTNRTCAIFLWICLTTFYKFLTGVDAITAGCTIIHGYTALMITISTNLDKWNEHSEWRYTCLPCVILLPGNCVNIIRYQISIFTKWNTSVYDNKQPQKRVTSYRKWSYYVPYVGETGALWENGA